MIKIIYVFLFSIIQTAAFTQIDINGKWFVSEKDSSAEIDNYIKDSITHGYNQIDYALGFSLKFKLTRDTQTYLIPEDELNCTEEMVFTENRIQNQTECLGISDKSYWLNGGKNGVYEWINKKTIKITYTVGLADFICIYRIKKKKNILFFVIKGNVQFTKLD